MQTAALPLPTPRRLPALLLIVALHVWIGAAWLGSRWVMNPPPERVGTLVWVATVPPPPDTHRAAQRAAQPTATPARRSTPVRQPATTPPPATTPAIEPPALRLVEAPMPQPPASQPRPTLLDSEATRRAIREAGRQPLLAERAAAATGLALVAKDERLREDAAKAGKGDCMKGEYAGAGMGLLSLPALALAAATGACAK